MVDNDTPTATLADEAEAVSSAVQTAADSSKKTIEKVKDTASGLASEAASAARKAATTGKDKASEALESLSGVIDEAASMVGDKVGPSYGDFGRRAASSVSSAAKTLQSKDIDDLIADTRTFVKKNPAVAIGAAAAVGFLLTRLIRVGSAGSRDRA